MKSSNNILHEHYFFILIIYYFKTNKILKITYSISNPTSIIVKLKIETNITE